MNDSRPHYVYRIYDAGTDVLLYVGISCNPDDRVKAHKQHAGWWPTSPYIEYEDFACEQEARDAEAVAICQEQPIHNLNDWMWHSGWESCTTGRHIGFNMPAIARARKKAKRIQRDRKTMDRQAFRRRQVQLDREQNFHPRPESLPDDAMTCCEFLDVFSGQPHSFVDGLVKKNRITPMDRDEPPICFTLAEFDRRMKEWQS